MTLSKEQLEFRRGSLGSSDVPLILDPDVTWGDASTVYWEKVGDAPVEDVGTAATDHGNWTEHALIKFAEHELNLAIQVPTTENPLEYRHPDSPYPCHATLDGICWKEPVGHGSRLGFYLVECKATIRYAPEFGEEDDYVPPRVALQTQQASRIVQSATGAECLGILCPVQRVEQGTVTYRMYRYPYDPALANGIDLAMAKWWADHIVKRVPPAVTKRTRQILGRLPREPKKVIELRGEPARWCAEQYHRAKDIVSEYEKMKDVFSSVLLASAPEASVIQIEGFDKEISMSPQKSTTYGPDRPNACPTCNVGKSVSPYWRPTWRRRRKYDEIEGVDDIVQIAAPKEEGKDE